MAAAAIVTAGIAAVGLGYQIYQDYRPGGNVDQQNEAAALQKAQAKQNAKDQLLSAQQSVSDIQNAIEQTAVDIADTKSKIEGYQSFLDRYSEYYKTETTKAQANIEALQSSGKSQYDSLMQALGYTDAIAGATGRVGADTSMAQVGGKAKENVIDYVGSDMTLDANGGLYGTQLTAANLDFNQLQLDLEAQRQEAIGNLDIYNMSLKTLQDSQKSMETSLEASKQRVTELQAWINDQFGG